MNNLTVTLFFLLIIANLSAEIAVKSFRKLESDMTARIDAPKKDQNGDVCAIIKVVTTQDGFTWEPDALGIKEVVRNGAEYWLYVPFGAKRLTINHSKLGILRDYMYPLPIEKACVYEMVLITGRIETTVIEEISKQWLLITPLPEKAMIYIDDVFVAKGEYHAQLSPGTYNYRVETPLYHTEAGKLEISDAKKELKVNLKPAFGYLTINTTPEAGATIIIDGKELTKTTPSTSEALASGEHSVQVIKEMYQPTTQKVMVADNQTTPVNFTLVPNFAELSITAPQQASIVINGQLKGKGGWNGRLSAGIYSVEAQMDKHRAAKQDIQLVIGDKKEITLQPTPIYGSVNIVTIPSGATISIDGKEYGTTPNTISKLLIGKYTLVMKKVGYECISKNIIITENNNSELNETLTIGNSFIENGKKKFKLKDYEGAILDLTNAIEIDPLNVKTYCLRGSSKYEFGDYKGAIMDCTKAIEINPEYSESYNIRGNAKKALKDSIGGIKDYNFAVNIIPFNADDFNNRGDAKYYLKNIIGAINDYTKAIELDSKNTNAYIFRGDAKQAQKDFNGAIIDYTKAIELDPNNQRAYETRAIAKLIINDYKGAVIDFDKLLSINPKDSVSYKRREFAKNVIRSNTVTDNIILSSTVTDIDGNTYHTVKIGSQIWMVENLKVTRYRNGDKIPNVTNNNAWSKLKTGSWCNYNNEDSYGRKFGKLYNWFAVNDKRNIAPIGWHIPNSLEWYTLETYLILNGYNYDGTTDKNKIAKSLAATTNWASNLSEGAIGENLSKNNKSLFSALPGGCRNLDGSFNYINKHGYWWKSNEYDSKNANRFYMYNHDFTVYWFATNKLSGFSVRCIKDY